MCVCRSSQFRKGLHSVRHAVISIVEAAGKAAAVPMLLLIGLFLRADTCWIRVLGAPPLVWTMEGGLSLGTLKAES